VLEATRVALDVGVETGRKRELEEVLRRVTFRQPDQGDARRVLVRERAEEHAIHDIEHGKRGADAERQCRDRGGGEDRIAAQYAKSVEEIL
jgi:hypothetical protein